VSGSVRRPAILLIAAWAVLVALPAGVREVMPPDEPRFALVARELRERVAAGDTASLIVPHLAGRVYTDKPPVLFWGIGLASLPLGGVGELATRVPSILAALAVLLLTLRAGRRLLGSASAGTAAALVLLTSFEFFQRAQWCSTDMLLAAFATAAGVFWSEAAFGSGPADGAGAGTDAPARRRRLALLGWLCVSAAVLTKGPVGLLWALLWPLCEAAGSRSGWRSLRAILSPAGIALFVLLCGGWLAAAERISPGFVSAVLWHQSVERYVNAWNNVQPFWFYLYQFPLDLLPWSLFLPAALLLAWKERRDASGGAAVHRALALLVVAGVLFFSTSSGKRGVYLLPGFPAAALLVTSTISAGPARLRAAWRRVPFLLLSVLGLVLAVAGPFRVAPLAGPVAAAATALGGAVLMVAGWVADRRFAEDRAFDSIRTACAGIGLVLFLTATLGGRIANEHQQAAAFGALVAANVPAGQAVAVERGKFELILYYAHRTGFEFERTKQLLDGLESGAARFAVLERPAWDEEMTAGRFDRLSLLAEGKISDTEYVIAAAGAAPRETPP
jgi:4-amino-4-deoxy-L-arabinose transferase-like glycosyltransferase